jgi:hypothetical protein
LEFATQSREFKPLWGLFEGNASEIKCRKYIILLQIPQMIMRLDGIAFTDTRQYSLKCLAVLVCKHSA